MTDPLHRLSHADPARRAPGPFDARAAADLQRILREPPRVPDAAPRPHAHGAHEATSRSRPGLGLVAALLVALLAAVAVVVHQFNPPATGGRAVPAPATTNWAPGVQPTTAGDNPSSGPGPGPEPEQSGWFCLYTPNAGGWTIGEPLQIPLSHDPAAEAAARNGRGATVNRGLVGVLKFYSLDTQPTVHDCDALGTP